MLASLHALLVAMVEFPLPILVAVRGQCLGGGLEVALAGGPIFAGADAQFGQPEIKLGVFAPAASCLLGWRLNQSAAEDLLWTGRSVDGAAALAMGLVTTLADDPEVAALAYFDEHLAPRSAAALACAVAAIRAPRGRELRLRLAEVEALYLERLMRTRDANEGLAAFLERRTPAWEHR
jgi:cyclohexa-1,5-dienecarbonyl-CoA hydratase